MDALIPTIEDFRAHTEDSEEETSSRGSHNSPLISQHLPFHLDFSEPPTPRPDSSDADDLVLALARMSTTTATPTKVKVAEPDVFDGSPYKFRDWLRQLTIFIRAREIKDDEKKILIALSYMKSGTATAWANRWFDKNGTKASLGSWADFQTELEAAFQDKDAKRKARERLETYKQRDARIDDFISRFDSLTADAGIDSSDDEQI